MEALCQRNPLIKGGYKERVEMAALQELNSLGSYSGIGLASIQGEVFE